MPEDARTPAAVLREHGLRARKSLGQNFLRDRSFLARIVDAAEAGAGDTVLEIGPGTGVLTAALAERAGALVAVELDDRLFEVLSAQYAGREGVRIVHDDALQVDPCDLFSGAYKLVGNIPYYITGPILRHYLEAACQPSLLVLMVQREVAERMAAHPGRMSLLSVTVQYYASVHIVTRVPAGAFLPRPKVDSAIVKLLPYRRADGSARQAAFFAVVRAGFSLKRKQLVNSMSSGLGIARSEAAGLLHASGIDPSRRAETLSVTEWEAVAASWAAREMRT